MRLIRAGLKPGVTKLAKALPLKKYIIIYFPAYHRVLKIRGRASTHIVTTDFNPLLSNFK